MDNANRLMLIPQNGERLQHFSYTEAQFHNNHFWESIIAILALAVVDSKGTETYWRHITDQIYLMIKFTDVPRRGFGQKIALGMMQLGECKTIKYRSLAREINRTIYCIASFCIKYCKGPFK